MSKRDRDTAFFLSFSPATFSKELADNGGPREEAQEVALERQWSGVQCSAPGQVPLWEAVQ